MVRLPLLPFLLPTYAASQQVPEQLGGVAGLGAEPACQAAATWVQGIQDLTIDVDGDLRRYLLYTPRPETSETSLPLVLMGPGSDMTPEDALHVSGFAMLADRERFSVAVMVGEGNNLNVVRHSRADVAGPDDMAYTRALLVDVAQHACIDHRIFCAGYSRGGRFCSRLASELPGVVLAVAPVGGIRYPKPNNATRPVPVIAIHGTSDPVNPYHGNGRNDYWFEAVPLAVSKWAAFNGCKHKEENGLSSHVWMRRHTACSDSADVVLITVEGGGHTWPGSTFSFDPRYLGSTNQEISSSILIWNFFKEHSARVSRSSEAVSGSFTDVQAKASQLVGAAFLGETASQGRGLLPLLGCVCLGVLFGLASRAARGMWRREGGEASGSGLAAAEIWSPSCVEPQAGSIASACE